MKWQAVYALTLSKVISFLKWPASSKMKQLASKFDEDTAISYLPLYSQS